MDYLEIAVRLVLATVVGGSIGLNRDLHGKPTGVRTLGLVGLGSALVVLAATGFTVDDPDWDAISRAIQGVMTGIGFLGAGVIIRRAGETEIQGLTTAACIWLTSCLGMVCGVGGWIAVVIAVPLLFLVLTLGASIEKAVHRRWGQQNDD
ncbi:MAG TPA: MgtC/SapB family protein [Xanthobacteraceae bacterium]|jgi:putative Mg2+ transporter-C (MgtC) family protein|nr:MgtC/SapB family protein [Xanthobacteraceae bacterium]